MTLALFTLVEREIVRFLRQRSRVVGALAQPVVFWVLLGTGLSPSFRPPGSPPGMGYMQFFFPGVLALVLLFTAIFATITVVEDRRGGFLQGVLAAPIGRSTIVLGQSLGATALAVIQGAIFLMLAPLAGIALSPGRVCATVGAMGLVGFALANLGLMIAWRAESTQGFHAVMNLMLLPLWFLSGAFFPPEGVARPLAWLMALDPLTYGLVLLRSALWLGEPGAGPAAGAPWAFALSTVFALSTLAGAIFVARRSTGG